MQKSTIGDSRSNETRQDGKQRKGENRFIKIQEKSKLSKLTVQRIQKLKESGKTQQKKMTTTGAL